MITAKNVKHIPAKRAVIKPHYFVNFVPFVVNLSERLNLKRFHRFAGQEFVQD